MSGRPASGAVGWTALGLCVASGALFGTIVLTAVASRSEDDLLLPGLLTWSAAAALVAGLVAIVMTPRGLGTSLSVVALLLGLFGVSAVGMGVGLNTATTCWRETPPGPTRQDLIALSHELDVSTATIECELSDPVDPVTAPRRYRVPAALALRGVRPFGPG